MNTIERRLANLEYELKQLDRKPKALLDSGDRLRRHELLQAIDREKRNLQHNHK